MQPIRSALKTADTPLKLEVHAMSILRRHARELTERLVRRMVHALQRERPSHIFGDDMGFRSLWDEICYDRQVGGGDPTRMIDEAIGANAHRILSSLSESEKLILTAAAIYDSGLDLEPSWSGELQVCDDLVAAGMLDRVNRLATNRDISRFTDPGPTGWR